MPEESEQKRSCGCLLMSRPFWHTFLMIFLPIFLILIFSASGIYYYESNVMYKLYKERKTRRLEIDRINLCNQLMEVSLDLAFLCKSHHLEDLINNKDERKIFLAREFMNISDTMKAYDQIRYIDKTGKEQVRVDFKNEKAAIVPENKLQNKSSRYYIRDTIRLGKDQVYVSPLDLNVEHGQVEVPYKPVLRIGRPVYDRNGKKAGIILINYLAKVMLDTINFKTTQLINEDGYWLEGGTKRQNWAFMFPNRQDESFSRYYPEIWKKICTSNSGQFFHKGGLITFSTIYPLEVTTRIINEGIPASRLYSKTPNWTGKGRYWKIISYLKNPGHLVGTDKFFNRLLLFSIILTIVFVFIAFTGSRLICRNRLTEASRKESEERLKLALESSDAVLWRWNLDTDTMAFDNNWARILGYPHEETPHKLTEWRQYIHPDDFALIVGNFKKNMEDNDGLVEAECRVYKKSAGLAWFLIRGKLISKTKSGEPEWMIGVLLDVTTRKDKELRLQILEEAVKAAPVGFSIADMCQPDTPLTYVNPAFQKITGFRADEVLNKNARILQGENTDNSTSKAIRKSIDNGESFNAVIKNYRKNGELFWNQMSLTPIRNQWDEVIFYLGIQQDITEQRNAELALRDLTGNLEKQVNERTAELKQLNEFLKQSEERFRLLAENTSDIISLHDPEGKYIYISPACNEILGFTPDELAGKFPKDYADQDDVGNIRGFFNEKNSENHESRLITWRARRKNGENIFLETSIRPIFEADNKLRGWVCASRDSTERIRNREQLELQRTALESAANGIVIVDRDAKIIWSNPAITKLTGYTEEELLGKNPSIMKSGKHSKEFYQEMWRTVLLGKVWHGEMINRRKNGSLYNEELTIAPVRNQRGEITHFVAIKQDITDRKRSELLLQERAAFMMNNPDPVMRADAEGIISECNPAGRKVFGDKIIGKKVEEIFPVIRKEQVSNPSGNVFQFEQNVGDTSFLFTVRMDTEVKSWYIYGSDITGRIHAEERQRQLNEELQVSMKRLEDANLNLEEANRHKSRFLSSMSHELRIPLNAIIGYGDLMKGQFFGKLNEKQLDYVKQIDMSGKHLLSLINDLLDIAKIDAGKLEPVIGEFSLEETVTAIKSMMRTQFDKKNIIVGISIAPEIGTIQADQKMFKQIMFNLLSNALKFTPENGKVTIHATSKNNNTLVVEVTDTGIGVPKEEQDKIFSEFHQADKVRDQQLGGTGIGLALTRRIVELHDGKIGVRSKPGKGSTFFFQLPWLRKLKEKTRQTEKDGKDTRHVKRKQSEYAEKYILVAEDNPVNTSLLLDILSVRGYKVKIAKDGIEAVEMATQTHPDLILMDIKMPRMDGLEATRRLRLQPEFTETPIIALTASTGDDAEEKQVEAGCTAHLPKPIDSEKLYEYLDKYLKYNGGSDE